MLSAHSCPVGSIGGRYSGGMSVYIREVTREMAKRGHRVDIYTRIHDPRDRQTYELGKNIRLIHLKAGADEEINKLAIYPHIPAFARNLEEFRKADGARYDLIFSHYWLSGLVGQYLREWWGVPHVTMFHTLGAIKNITGVGEDEPELRLEAERDLVENCDLLIAPTRKEKIALRQYFLW